MFVDLNSRKYRMGLISMIVIMGLGSLILINPLFMEVIPTMIGAIVTVYGIYCGMNVANKWTLGKAQGATVQTANQLEAAQDTLPQVQFPEEE